MILDAPFWTKNEPGVAHEGAPLRPVRFQVEFHHMAKAAEAYPGCGQEQLLLNEPGLLDCRGKPTYRRVGGWRPGSGWLVRLCQVP